MTVHPATAWAVRPFGAALRRLAPLLVAVLLAACTGGGATSTTGPAPPTQPRTLTYQAGPAFLHLTFDYPGSWTARPSGEDSTFETWIVYLSNQPLVAPCKTTKPDVGVGVPCFLAVKHLEPGGVLAWWSENGMPGWSFDKNAKGQPLTVAGRRAKLLIEPGCHDIGGEVSMTAYVERPAAPDNWYGFNACIRGPRVEQAEAQVRALLASARFGEGTA